LRLPDIWAQLALPPKIDLRVLSAEAAGMLYLRAPGEDSRDMPYNCFCRFLSIFVLALIWEMPINQK